MATILHLDFTKLQPKTEVSKAESLVSKQLIKPATTTVTDTDTATEKAAEPIKDMKDIIRTSEYLISKKRWRDNMLFIVGINFGLRISDLRTLRFSTILNEDGTFKDSFAIVELKTKNTRKVTKNRHVTINRAVIEAATLYLENTPDVSMNDYMFKSISNNGKYGDNPITRQGVNDMLRKLKDELNLPNRMSSHSLRKTFGYHQMVMSNHDPRKLILLQKIFGHSSSDITLDYIGVTRDEIQEAYLNLNLGLREDETLIDSSVEESEAQMA